jgi:hypothetical protein
MLREPIGRSSPASRQLPARRAESDDHGGRQPRCAGARQSGETGDSYDIEQPIVFGGCGLRDFHAFVDANPQRRVRSIATVVTTPRRGGGKARARLR